MLKKANMNAEPMIIEGRKAWHIGKAADGREVYQLEKGFCRLFKGVAEFGEAVDEEGNFLKAAKPAKEEKPPVEKKQKKGKG